MWRQKISMSFAGLLLCLVMMVSVVAEAAEKKPAKGTLSGGKNIVFPSWTKDSFLEIAEDAAEAAEENKHVILYFHLNGCPYCAVMMQESFVEAPFVDYIKTHFSVIEINMKGDRDVAFDANTSLKEKELTKQLKVFTTPTILFLDQTGKPVLRLNGYRSREDFKHALDYVKAKAYQKQKFVTYLQNVSKPARYDFLAHKSFLDTTDLSNLPKEKVVTLLFENKSCVLCADFHNRILANPEVQKALEKMSVVRMNADAATAFIGLDGTPTSPKDLAKQYGMSYTPGMVFLDQGKEVGRIGGMLRTFHATMMLRYVAEKQYKNYPRWLDFATIEEEKILQSGADIDIWK